MWNIKTKQPKDLGYIRDIIKCLKPYWRGNSHTKDKRTTVIQTADTKRLPKYTVMVNNQGCCISNVTNLTWTDHSERWQWISKKKKITCLFLHDLHSFMFLSNQMCACQNGFFMTQLSNKSPLFNGSKFCFKVLLLFL